MIGDGATRSNSSSKVSLSTSAFLKQGADDPSRTRGSAGHRASERVLALVETA